MRRLSAVRTAMMHLVRLIQLAFLCLVLVGASTPARSEVVLDPIMVVDEGPGDERTAARPSVSPTAAPVPRSGRPIRREPARPHPARPRALYLLYRAWLC